MSCNAFGPFVPGDDHTLNFNFSQDGVAIDQTGNELRVVIKANMTDADVDALFDEVTVASSPAAEQGVIQVLIPRTVSLSFPPGGRVYMQAKLFIDGLQQTAIQREVRVSDAVIDD